MTQNQCFRYRCRWGVRSLEQHDHRAYETRDARVRTSNRDEQDDARRGQVEEYQGEDELPEGCHCRDKADEAIHNTSEEERRDNAERKDVE